MFQRLRARGAVLAATALVTLPLIACDREDEAQVEEQLDRLGKQAGQAWEKAKPELEEAGRKAGNAVGKGLEAAGEAIERGGEELQEEVRDTTVSSLPDTVTRDTVVLR